MRFRTLALSFALASALVSFASAEIIDDVRTALARGNFSAAESQLNSYRAQRGVTPEYVEAYSWMARAAFATRQYDQAAAYAEQTKTLALGQLKQRSLDAEPHLPIALGAALEVQAEVLIARG